SWDHQNTSNRVLHKNSRDISLGYSCAHLGSPAPSGYVVTWVLASAESNRFAVKTPRRQLRGRGSSAGHRPAGTHAARGGGTLARRSIPSAVRGGAAGAPADAAGGAARRGGFARRRLSSDAIR